jgi:hypothetical protein
MSDDWTTLCSTKVGKVATIAGRAFIVRKITEHEDGSKEVTVYERDASTENLELAIKADAPEFY